MKQTQQKRVPGYHQIDLRIFEFIYAWKLKVSVFCPYPKTAAGSLLSSIYYDIILFIIIINK